MARPRGIGGSDAAAAIGVNPHKSAVALWLEKTGRVEPPDLSEQMRWGQILEPVVIAELERVEATTIHRNTETVGANGLVSSLLLDVPFLFCTPDGYVGDDGLVEVKTGGAWQTSAWADDAIPIQYEVQCRHNMIVTGKKYALVGALLGGQKFEVRRVTHDDDLARMIMERLIAFWSYVEADEPPPAEWATTDDLKLLYPSSNGEVCDLSDAPGLVDALAAARRANEIAKAEVEQAELAIKQRMGECEVAVVDGERVISWASHERKSVDTKRLKEEYPDLYSELVRPTTVRPFKVLA